MSEQIQFAGIMCNFCKKKFNCEIGESIDDCRKRLKMKEIRIMNHNNDYEIYYKCDNCVIQIRGAREVQIV